MRSARNVVEKRRRREDVPSKKPRKNNKYITELHNKHNKYVQRSAVF